MMPIDVYTIASYKTSVMSSENVMDDRLLLASEAARRLGRSVQCIRVYADKQVLPCTRTESGTRLFKLSDVMEFGAKLKAQEARPEPIVA
jgi:hypothetical protein